MAFAALALAVLALSNAPHFHRRGSKYNLLNVSSFTVPKKEVTEFTREIGAKVDNNTLKTGMYSFDALRVEICARLTVAVC